MNTPLDRASGQEPLPAQLSWRKQDSVITCHLPFLLPDFLLAKLGVGESLSEVVQGSQALGDGTKRERFGGETENIGHDSDTICIPL